MYGYCIECGIKGGGKMHRSGIHQKCWDYLEEQKQNAEMKMDIYIATVIDACKTLDNHRLQEIVHRVIVIEFGQDVPFNPKVQTYEEWSAEIADLIEEFDFGNKNKKLLMKYIKEE